MRAVSSISVAPPALQTGPNDERSERSMPPVLCRAAPCRSTTPNRIMCTGGATADPRTSPISSRCAVLIITPPTRVAGGLPSVPIATW